MIKDSGSQFSLFATGAVEKAVVNDKDIFTRVVSKGLNIIVNDICSKKGCKTKPVSFGGIQETVKSVLGEIFPKRPDTLLHVHASSCKYVAKLVF